MRLINVDLRGLHM